jgi:Zn-dependent alcohol dehydrogenase
MGILEGDSNPKVFIPELMRMQLAGKLPYDKLITTFRFENINAALDACDAKTVVKPVLIFD